MLSELIVIIIVFIKFLEISQFIHRHKLNSQSLLIQLKYFFLLPLLIFQVANRLYIHNFLEFILGPIRQIMKK